MPSKSRRANEPVTTQQRLASIIKSARDLMRTDPGLNGDLDRIPQLAMVLFLKAFDDMEEQRPLTEPGYQPVLPKKLRWRTWAGDRRFTGPDFLEWFNGTLLPELRALRAPGDKRTLSDELRDVFEGLDNRMRSGYLLRDLVNLLDEITFTSSDDIHTIAFLYESMLREIRDAAGDSGEFYTPRPVIRFIVEQVDPKLGETVLDPAAGTGGFLVEAAERMKRSVRRVQDRRKLHDGVRGIEKKSLPYLLATMNLLLHGIDLPNLTRENALTAMRRDRSRASQVDVVITNPPFGGAEESAVIKAFAAGEQTKETAWLFLSAVLDKLKPGGRCGIVVPNSVLFDTGQAPARIKKRLLEAADVHTIVRLPEGVFAPYTPIPTNLVFFEKTGSTKRTWFYEMLPPEGRKRYSKTRPMQFEEFADCQAWWGGAARDGREENERAWVVDAATIVESGYNLDLRNPHAGDDLAHRPPAELVAELIDNEKQIMQLLEELATIVGDDK